MKKGPLFLGCLLLMGFSSEVCAQVDSLILKLQDRNLSVLNQQIDKIMRHGTLRAINPDQTTWPAIRDEIVSKVEAKSFHFNPPAKVLVSSFLAETLVRERQVTKGYLLIKESLQMVKALPGLPQAYVFVKYADIFKHLNRFDSAIVYAEKVLDISHQIKNDSLEKVSLDQVALLCYKSKNYSKAEFYFKRLAIHPISTDVQRKDYFNTIALSFRNRLLYDSAQVYFRKALQIATDLKDKTWFGLISGNIGYVFFLQKRYSEALPPLLIDVDYSFRGHNDESALKALSTVTSIYVTQHNLSSAKLYYDSLVRNVIHVPIPEVQVEFLKTSADYFELIGDLPRANYFLRAYSTLADSLRDVANVTRATQLESQFDFDRQVDKIETLERQSLTHAAENRQKNNLLIGTFILILLAAGLLYVLNRSNRFKHQTNKILQAQNAQITEQADYLNHLNATKDKLFSIISHDLRGPINSLKALMGMVRRDMITAEEFKHFSGQLQNNVEYVHFTLDNVLYWSRSQLQGIEARPQPTTLSDLVIENFNLLSEPLKAKGIHAENYLSPDLSVMADPNLIRLVFRNLISNAIKFTSQGGRIEIRSTTEGNYEIISVCDTGTGIPAESIPQLFKANTGTVPGTSGEKGTGLGLSLCKEMIEKNNGKIWVESVAGAGTKFIFSLPKK